MDYNELNTKSFSTPAAVRDYSALYLRSSEEYVIEKFAFFGAKVLDLGCGTGRTTTLIKKRGAEVVGADISAPMIERARELHPNINFEVMDALALRFPDNHFDFVFFSFNGLDNLHPVSRRIEAVGEIKRVLKKGGIFAYASHNSFAPPRTFSGWRAFFRNLPRLRLGAHYRKENHGFGELFQYYNNMSAERKLIKKAGFDFLEVVSNGRAARLPKFFQFFLERFPIYLVKK